ncbi:TPA: HAD family hydrolase [Campylobacter coli]|uniref:HAD family hydrolase n=1 Tax=Campylobacter coli TaxID=195 RepID=UPI000931B652|nr:HAD hydrolase-like protein [Campylobacter coli]ECQ9132819.1 HAD family hydrolase [Campylobacter jejuni]EAK0255154.1 HAD family hydrolase [Campylobacter coli]ECK7919323.1 HAD family hydrolase [Campylobacter coli]EDO7026312.1 HAD family hydrolase [Campylobacter coli]MCH3763284.1 HAD hydrolase-like protein [Campylobacter coli]
MQNRILIKNILWDFDGVIIDSLAVRDYGFREIFKEFDKVLVEKLIEYHSINGGLSRFHKIRHFFNEILKKDIDDKEVKAYADKFSLIMRKELVKSKYFILDSVNFIKENYKKYNFHIVSGSEHNELNFLCQKLQIHHYFYSINGSPTPKIELVKNLLIKEGYKKSETILIGDSINDYEAAKESNIAFYGYNNQQLKDVSKKYIERFDCMSML